MISINNLNVRYHNNEVLNNVNLTVREKRRTAIVGPNGAGKSTLIKAIMNLIPISNGEIKINDLDYKSVNKFITYVPQKSEVNWDFPTTVLDVVLMGRFAHKGWFKRPDKNDKKIAEAALEKMKMTEYKNRQISELSGGQRQRVFIARAICQDAQVYIMDEPFQGIDVTTEKIIVDFMKGSTSLGKTFLVVHHQLNTIPEYFDDVIFLNHTVIAYGDIEHVWTEKNIQHTYQQPVEGGV